MAEKEKITENLNQVDMLKHTIADFKTVLKESINECNQVFLIAHTDLDFDAIASLAGTALICKRFKKAPYIIIDDDLNNMSDHLLWTLDRIKDKFIVITTSDYEQNKTDNDLLIVLDTNKEHKTYLQDKYKQFKNIIIIDHHTEDDNTIKRSKKLIVPEVSSCSELIYYIVKQFNITSKNLDYYTLLLAGVYLDTDNKNKNMYPSTYDCIKELQLKGADQSKIAELFSLDYDSDRRVHRLIDKAHFKNIRIATAISGEEEYSREEIAKTADHLLKYNCDVSIASGKGSDGRYFVSARSKNESFGIDEVMRILNNGGGNYSSAACEPLYVDQDKDEKEIAKEIEEKLIKIITRKYKESI